METCRTDWQLAARAGDSKKGRNFVRIQRKQLKAGTEIETGLQTTHSVTQNTDFTKAFFTFKMSYGFAVH
jgi:hypothetical protein